MEYESSWRRNLLGMFFGGEKKCQIVMSLNLEVDGVIFNVPHR